MERQSLVSLMEQENSIMEHITSFLNKKEVCRLSQTNKTIQETIETHQKQMHNQDFLKWKDNKLATLMKIKRGSKKKQQQIKCIETDAHNILKMRIFDMPVKYLEQLNWIVLGEKSPEYIQMAKSDNQIELHNNIFFKNRETNDILYVNRTLVDKSLNITENFIDEEEEYQSTKYEELYSGDDFTQTNFDFSNMESMLSRQRQLLKRINKKETVKQYNEDNVNYMGQVKMNRKITIILCHGGCFSVGIFNEKGECTYHKSDHKYVVRKKAGKRQLTSGRGVSSIGGEIRMDQEKKHQEKVHNILTEKLEQIEKSDIVFLHAPGINKLILIKENEPLLKIQHKLRSICLSPRKANYTEVERIYKTITKINIITSK